MISESHIAVQVSYSIKDPQTYTREVTPLINFVQTDADWTMLIVTYEEEYTLDADGTVIHVVPAYKWTLA